ncbi:MAG TPA: hypothetical protein V6D25_13435 [Leptolyngbyaceae cyanobacterium]
MIISDLSYLEAVEANGVFGGKSSVSFDVEKDVDIYIDIDSDIDVNNHVDSDVDLSDNLAIAESSADAVGNRTLTEAYAFTFATGWGSSSNAYSLSAVD